MVSGSASHPRPVPTGPTIRERIEADERATLSPHAQLSERSKGRQRPQPQDDLRPVFQHDRDTILHSKAFRRLAGKTQVFLAPEGDHYRTRITHTLEVAQFARSVTRFLGLNEMLTEAIVMGHDLGHTPFGHAGEKVLAHLLPNGFHHVKQSIRVVEQLEHDGEGLNLTEEVRDGILKHSKGKGQIFSDNPNLTAMTLEGQIVRIADISAYVNHDFDDARRAGLVRDSELPDEVARELGRTHGQRIDTLVRALVEESRFDEKKMIRMADAPLKALYTLRDFLYDKVYESKTVKDEFEKAQRVLAELYEYFVGHPDEFRQKHWPRGTGTDETIERAVADYLCGMTDRYAMRQWEQLRMPRGWTVY
jgi:dGTPase